MNRPLPACVLIACLAALIPLASGCGRPPISPPRAAALVTVAQGAQPVLSLAADRQRVAIGERVTYTLRISVPPEEKAPARNVALHWGTDKRFRLAQVLAPVLVANTATIRWKGGQATSPPAVFRIRGTSRPVPGLKDSFTLLLGDFPPGDSAQIKVTCARRR